MKTTVQIGLLLCVVLIAAACGGGSAEAKAGGEENVPPMAQLKAMSADLTAKMDVVKAPIDQVDTLVSDLQALPAKLNISPSDFNAACTATIENGQVQVSAELTADVEAKAEIEAMLTQLQTVTASLKAAPDNARTLMTAAGEAAVKLPVLASEVSAQAQAKLSAPMGVSEEAKAAAQAELASLANVQNDISTQIESAKSLSSELPQMATEAMGKITAALAASASTAG